jgi:KAP family P-loop domain
VTRPIPIVADIPTEAPGLGFPEYVEALADAIRGGEPPQFTIGLYGSWGSGKSSLLKAIAKKLNDERSDMLPVFFDAWRHERADHIVVPLLYGISEAAERSGNTALKEHLRRALSALLFSLNFKVAGLGVDMSTAKDNWDTSGVALDEAFAKPFEELRRLPDTLGDKRVAVLIDDLDRCSPEKVVSLLEAINLIMDVEGFIFVLALDYDVLIKAVVSKYPHVSGHEFIEKMVQLPFRVPPLTVAAEEFLGELIPEWEVRREQFPEGFSQAVMDVADLGLRANPRQIKRLINSFLVIDRIVDRRGLEVDPELMAAMIGLQLRWPDHYQDLQDAILAEDENPFDPLARNDDDALIRYSARFFSATPANEVLRQMLQFTAVVATEPDMAIAAAERRLVRDVRAEMRERLMEGLRERGFAQSVPRSPAWYQPDLPGYRVNLKATIFRLERSQEEGGRKWQLLESYDYRDYASGLETVDRLRGPNGSDL